RPLRRRLDLRLLEDRPDSACSELHAETGELAPESVGSPSPDSRGRAAPRALAPPLLWMAARGTAMGIRPPARHQLTMPTQKCRRRHKRGPPPRLPWQHPAERRKQCPVSLRQLRTSKL